jgi:hypothetical protein
VGEKLAGPLAEATEHNGRLGIVRELVGWTGA